MRFLRIDKILILRAKWKLYIPLIMNYDNCSLSGFPSINTLILLLLPKRTLILFGTLLIHF